MKPPPVLVMVSGLVLLATCLLQQIIGPAPDVRPTRPAPSKTRTALPSTLTPEPTFMFIDRWTPMPATTPTPFVEVQPLESPAISGTIASSAWTFWPAQFQDWFAVTANDETVWAGTPDGAYRIEPQTGAFTTYPEVGPIKMLLPVENGRLFAAGSSGLFFFDGLHWRRVGSFDLVDTLGIDQVGDLWIVDLNGRFGPTGFHFTGHIPPDDAVWTFDYNDPYHMPQRLSMQLSNCQTWAAIVSQPVWSVSKLYSHRTPQECEALQTAYTLMPHLNAVLALVAIDRDGSTWSVAERTVYHRVGNTTTGQTLPTDQVMTIVSDPVHGVWLGTERGVWYSNGETLRAIPLDRDSRATLRPRPRNIAIDSQGNAWIITAQGVQRLSANDTKWQTVTDFGLAPGINSWPLGVIAAAHEGGIWATHGGDLWRFGGSTSMPLTGTVPLEPYCRLIHLTVDWAGNVWAPLGVCGAAVFRPEIKQWVHYASPYYHNHLDRSGGVGDIFIGGDGAVYAGGKYSSLYRFVGFGAARGPIEQSWQLVRMVQQDELLALGGDAGHRQWSVNCQTGEVWREQTETTSEPNNSPTTFVTAFGKVFAESTSDRYCAMAYRWYFDSRSWLWVYDGVNLFRFDGQAWQPANQPKVGTVQDMTSGPDGRVWIVGERGVAIYDPALDHQP